MAIGLAGLLAARLAAQTITTDVSRGTNTDTGGVGSGTFAASSTDLANSTQSTFGSIVITSGSAAFSSAVSKLVDGSVYGGDSTAATPESFTPNNGTVVTLTFNTTVNTAGYNLSAINVLTGTAQDRGGQNFSVSWAAPGSGSYTSLLSVSAANGGTAEVEVYTTSYVSGGGDMVSGVGSLRFTFTDIGSNGQSMYREIDVLGSVTAIPEPGTWAAIAGVAALGIVMVRRKRN